VLELDWANLASGTVRTLARTGVSAVIGADLIYTAESSRALADVVARVLQPGGTGYFVHGGLHRPHCGDFPLALRAKGLHVEQFTIPMTEEVRVLHSIFATAEEVDQVFNAFIVTKANITGAASRIVDAMQANQMACDEQETMVFAQTKSSLSRSDIKDCAPPQEQKATDRFTLTTIAPSESFS
jgi:hypothetical protein